MLVCMTFLLDCHVVCTLLVLWTLLSEPLPHQTDLMCSLALSTYTCIFLKEAGYVHAQAKGMDGRHLGTRSFGEKSGAGGRIACSIEFLFIISSDQALVPPSIVPGTHSSVLARNCISVGTGCRPFLRTATRRKEHDVFSVM